MLDKLQAVYGRYEELCAKSEQPDFYNDPKKAAALLREKNDLEPIVEAYQAYRRAQQDLADAQELMSDPEMRELCQETYKQAKEEMERLHDELRILLLPKDPNDEKNVIVEIRGGVGGEESALFAHSLFRMYSMYAAKMGWKIQLLNYNDTELGGVKEADFIIDGIRRPGAYIHRYGGGAAGNGRSGRSDQSGRHRNAGLQSLRRRRSARQQDLLRRAADPQTQRHRGGLPGGKIPGAEPGKVHDDAGQQTL